LPFFIIFIGTKIKIKSKSKKLPYYFNAYISNPGKLGLSPTKEKLAQWKNRITDFNEK
jgi:hypothetical protein